MTEVASYHGKLPGIGQFVSLRGRLWMVEAQPDGPLGDHRLACIDDDANGEDPRAPAPIKACPWCGTAFTPQSFRCVPHADAPTNLELRCVNHGCPFTGDRALPVVTVDEAIYRRLPAFLIATIDKFAALPWNGHPRLPRTRGDRPDRSGLSRPLDAAPPHPRGSTVTLGDSRITSIGSPAPAGIDPTRSRRGCPLARLPRTRGDRPSYTTGVINAIKAPPHPRESPPAPWRQE